MNAPETATLAPVETVCTLRAADGRRLAGQWFEPTQSAHAVALVNAAGGVPQVFYRAFARWLAARGYAVLTYDYRGMAASSDRPLAQENATMRDWATLDMAAALAAARARCSKGVDGPRLPLLWVGHSFGGNCAAFAPDIESVDALLLVASGTGERRLYPWPQRGLLWVFFSLWLPLLLRLFGQLPGWALGPGALPLPAGAARQWGQWAGRRNWAFADPAMQPHNGAARVQCAVHVWGVSDDRLYAPQPAVTALASHFSQAALRQHVLRPADVGLRRLGHFGVFRRQSGPLAWPHLFTALERAVPRLRPGYSEGP